MRYTLLKGINDKLNYEFSGDVGLICAVMDIGKAECELVYSVVMKGNEAKEFLSKNALKSELGVLNEIIDENEYKITAFDW